MPGSKSLALRLMLAWALSKTECGVTTHSESDDVAAMMDCAREIFAAVSEKRDAISEALNVRESAALLRFVMPVLGALGITADIIMEGRLPERPMDALISQLLQHGMNITKPTDERYHVEGQLLGGIFEIPGDQSSQFITGLLMALPIIHENSELRVIGEIQSRPYVDMTLKVLRESGIEVIEEEPGDFYIPGGQEYRLEGEHEVEGDWSAAAIWLAAGACLEDDKTMTVEGLDLESLHGDRVITDIIREMGAEVFCEGDRVTVKPGKLRGIMVDARHIPDLVPAITIMALKAEGKTTIMNAERLRLKESDRLAAICQTVRSLGGLINERPDGLEIFGGHKLHGGWVRSFGDHRIAMMAACLRGLTPVGPEGDIEIDGAEAVTKSYPGFFEDYRSLGGGLEEI